MSTNRAPQWRNPVTALPSALRVRCASGFVERLRGLRGLHPFARCDVLHLPACRSVHTFGMRVAIDVVFVDRRRRIVRAVPRVRPGRVLICWSATDVWEFRAGSIAAFNLKIAARLPW